MTDVKRLLDEATPLPWREVWERSDPEGDYPTGIKGNDGERNNWVVRHDDDLGTPLDKNNTLIVYAVNRLPDYEAALDVLERLVRDEYPARPLHEIAATWGNATEAEVAVLRRLRGDA